MTKIMTVILGIENFDDLDEKITLTNEMFTGYMSRMLHRQVFSRGKRFG